MVVGGGLQVESFAHERQTQTTSPTHILQCKISPDANFKTLEIHAVWKQDKKSSFILFYFSVGLFYLDKTILF